MIQKARVEYVDAVFRPIFTSNLRLNARVLYRCMPVLRPCPAELLGISLAPHLISGTKSRIATTLLTFSSNGLPPLHCSVAALELDYNSKIVPSQIFRDPSLTSGLEGAGAEDLQCWDRESVD